LGPVGSLQTSGVNISAGATFDVSACGNYVFGNNSSLGASGNGVIVGTSAARLMGGLNNFISLRSNPINLLCDGVNPSLYVPQALLSLAGNPFTINSSTGNPFPPGSYPVIQQATGNISATGNFPAVTGSAIGAGQTGFIVISNNVVNLVIASKSELSLNIPVVRGDRTVLLTFSGLNSNLKYRVQANNNLTTTNWTTLFANVTGTNGLAAVIDTGATNNTQRFYRVVTP
jgi:hypothetical protein